MVTEIASQIGLTVFAFFASDIFLHVTVVDRLSTILITMDTFFQCKLVALYSKLHFLLALQYLIHFILTRLQHTKMNETHIQLDNSMQE